MQGTRRHFLRGIAVAAASGIAGCGSLTGSETPADGDPESDSPTPTDTAPEWFSGKRSALTPNSAVAGFGMDTDISADGSVALVGDWLNNAAGNQAGAGFIFEHTGSGWTQQAQLTGSDSDQEDSLGMSVALSGDGSIAVLGAPVDEDPNGQAAGSAYVFVRRRNWESAKLVPPDGDKGDAFGGSIAVTYDGSEILIGAGGDEDPNGTTAGSVYAFTASGETQKLTPEDGDSWDEFGSSIAISNDGSVAVIGAGRDEDPNGEGAGAVYVFEKSGGEWTQSTKLAADDGDDNDWFGISVSVADGGSTILVGAVRDEIGTDTKHGSAYVFEQAGDTWEQQAKLTPPTPETTQQLGGSLALNGDGTRALIGAVGDENAEGEATGAVYQFARSDDAWESRGALPAPDRDENSLFGRSVSFASKSSTAVVGMSNAAFAYGEPSVSENTPADTTSAPTDGAASAEKALRQWFEAVNAGDVQAANAVTHPEGDFYINDGQDLPTFELHSVEKVTLSEMIQREDDYDQQTKEKIENLVDELGADEYVMFYVTYSSGDDTKRTKYILVVEVDGEWLMYGSG